MDKTSYVDIYTDWLKESIRSSDFENGITRISVPFLDIYNDHIQIYVLDKGNGSYRLTDSSKTLNNLETTGVTIKTSKHKKILNQILNGFGVSFDETNVEIYKDCTLSSYPQAKNMLIQAMQSVSDMFMLSKSNVSSLFIEEVNSYPDINNISYVSDAQFSGKSGLTHKFDYTIPKNKNYKETLNSVYNKINIQQTSVLCFSSLDLENKRDSRFVAIVNDQEKNISDDIVNALNSYSIDIIPWSEREKILLLA